VRKKGPLIQREKENIREKGELRPTDEEEERTEREESCHIGRRKEPSDFCF